MTSKAFAAPLPACMGGFCTRREQCARYHQHTGRKYPAERLCRTRERDLFLAIAPVPAVTAPNSVFNLAPAA